MIKKNVLGFTLIETMIALAISTGAILATYQVIQNSQKRLNFVESRDEVTQVHREIMGLLTNRYTCSKSLVDVIAMEELPKPVGNLINENGNIIWEFPKKIDRVEVKTLRVTRVDASLAELEAEYAFKIAGKEEIMTRSFRIELEREKGIVVSCISRGTLGIDPKEACDLAVGYDDKGQSYYQNGKCNFTHATCDHIAGTGFYQDEKCNFPKASCEQSGRVWDEVNKKCSFSEEDLEALRKEICFTIGYGEYDSGTQRCMPSKEMLEAVEKLLKK